MTIAYSVFESPHSNDGTLYAADHFIFVPHKFSWMAFLVPIIWLPLKRMWVAFFAYLAIMIMIETAAFFVFGNIITTVISLFFSLIFAFEANAIRRWSLRAKGWHDHGLVMGSDILAAEYHFFSSWLEQQGSDSNTFTKKPLKSEKKAVMLPQTMEVDVIGMFPKPQGVK